MMIEIEKVTEDRFKVIVNSKIRTEHHIVLTNSLHIKITKNKVSKRELILFSFEFLLKMEPNTSILAEFDLGEISRFYPKFFRETEEWCTNIKS